MKHLLTLYALFLFILTSNAQCYSGDCENGIGTYYFENGDEYSGQFENSNITGIGFFLWKEGSQYYGMMQNGIIQGWGLFAAPGAEKWTYGSWENNELAQGYSFEAGTCVLGNCEDGIGVFMDTEGNMFTGEFSNGSKSGYGRLNNIDGSVYIGNFENGYYSGQGELFNPDGTREKGEFTGGYLKN